MWCTGEQVDALFADKEQPFTDRFTRSIEWDAEVPLVMAQIAGAAATRLPQVKPCTGMLLGVPGGAGGNRTPVHQPMPEPATTIPGIDADAASPAGRLSARADDALSFQRVSSLSCGQRSFPPSSSASGAGLRWIGPVRHFCSR